MSIAPNLADLPHLPPNPDRPLRVLPPQVGGAQSKLNVAVRALMSEAAKFRRTSAEVRENIPLPSKRHEIISEAAAGFGAKYRAIAATVNEESQGVAQRVASATAVAPYNDTQPLHVLMSDARLTDRFHAMTEPERMGLLARVTQDPAANLRWAEALIRQPVELSGLNVAQHAALKRAALQALQPDLAAALDAEVTQVAHAREALKIAAEELRDTAPGAWTELSVTDPAAASALHT
jgi:hypothetical protein